MFQISLKRNFKVTVIDEAGNLLKFEAIDCIVSRTISNRLGLEGNVVIETIKCKRFKVSKK